MADGIVAPSRLRLAIVDDHDLVTGGLVAAITSTDRVDVCYAGPSPVAAATARPHVTLLDVHLGPGTASLAANVAVLRRAGCGVLLISAHSAVEPVRAGVVAGATGFVAKSTSTAELQEAIEAVAAGTRYVSRDLAAMLLADRGAPPPPPTAATMLRLTVAGLHPESIAARLAVTPAAVRETLDESVASWTATPPQ